MKPALPLFGLAIGGLLLASRKSSASSADSLSAMLPAPAPSPRQAPPRPAPPRPAPPRPAPAREKVAVTIGPATINAPGSVQIPAGFRALPRDELAELAGAREEIANLGDAPGTIYPLTYQGRRLAVLVTSPSDGGSSRDTVLLERVT